MGQTTNPDRPFQVGNKTYTMRFSVRALAALQDHYGLNSLEEIGERLADTSKMSVKDLCAIVWAGLRTHHPETSMEDVMGIMDDLTLDRVKEMVASGFAAASPPEERGNGKGRPRKPGPSTG